MFNDITIKQKMMFFILGLTVIIYSITLGYTIYSLRKDAIMEAKELADAYASDKANNIKAKLDEDMAITRAMTLIIQDYVYLPAIEREEMQFQLMQNILRDHPKYEAVWMSWQLQYVDSTWQNEYGRVSINCYWDNGEIKTSQERKDLEGFVYDGLYYQLLMGKKEELSAPYEFDSYDLDSDGKLLAVSPTKTLMSREGQPIGVMGTDMSLEKYNKMTDIEGYKQGYAFLIANNGTIVAHNNPALINQPLSLLDYHEELDFDLDEKVELGESISFNAYSSEFKGSAYISIAPIQVGRSDSPWSVGIIVPYSEITASINSTLFWMVLVAILGLLFLSYVIWKISNDIVSSLESTNILLKDISVGDINMDNRLEISSNNRLGQMSESVNVLMETLSQKADFSKQIGEGNLEAKFEAASDNDVLGHSLLSMRNSLKEARNEDVRRSWSNEGLAKFAEMLQTDAESLNELCTEIISALVKYLNIVQGGIFLINKDDPEDIFIELKGSYAYDRKKFLTKRIELNEGLVAQSILEKNYIYLREVPQNYVNVTSGLGKANPNTILIIPLMINEEIFGALELVSFNKFEKHEIEFIQKLGENIASTVSSAKTNDTTKKLLEQSKIQAEELRSQEEEMRQNMEELQATQEEMKRKEQEYIDRIKQLEEEQGISS